jgi:hypothetical protein
MLARKPTGKYACSYLSFESDPACGDLPSIPSPELGLESHPKVKDRQDGNNFNCSKSFTAFEIEKQDLGIVPAFKLIPQ